MKHFKPEDYADKRKKAPAKKKPVDPMEKMAMLPQIIAEETAAVVKSFDEQAVRAKVRAILDKALNQVMLKSIGFNNRWGDGWEVDHCNGRAGESMVGDWLRGNAEDSVKQWLSDAVKELPKIPAGAIKSMKKDYLEQIERAVNHAISDEAEIKAAQILEEVFDTEIKKAALKKIYPNMKEE